MRVLYYTVQNYGRDPYVLLLCTIKPDSTIVSMHVCGSMHVDCLPVCSNLTLQRSAVRLQWRQSMPPLLACLLERGVGRVAVWHLSTVCSACRSQGTLALVSWVLLHMPWWPVALCTFPTGCFAPAHALTLLRRSPIKLPCTVAVLHAVAGCVTSTTISLDGLELNSKQAGPAEQKLSCVLTASAVPARVGVKAHGHASRERRRLVSPCRSFFNSSNNRLRQNWLLLCN